MSLRPPLGARLAALGPDTAVGKFLASRGPGLHHVAYQTEDIAATLEQVLDHYAEFFKFVNVSVPAVDPKGVPVPRPPPISTDGVHVDRPFTREERPALLAALRALTGTE